MAGLPETIMPSVQPRHKKARRWHCLMLAGLLLLPAAAAFGEPADYPSATLQPGLTPGWNAHPNQLDIDAPEDEAQSGKTEAGTPVLKRNEDQFPAEGRNVLLDLDSLPGPDGAPHPFDYDLSKADAHNAIRGKNTWMFWGEGNEIFWNWVQQHGYGLTDFLVLLDSRDRGIPLPKDRPTTPEDIEKSGKRFKRSGLTNQPGMEPRTAADQRVLGLFLDQAGPNVRLPGTGSADPSKPTQQLFPVGDYPLYKDTLSKLADDGLDPAIYGYPSGILGLRLFLNPDFFGDTKAAADARKYWNDKVVGPGDNAYYDPKKWVSKDPKLVRPFRVSMSCGFCHIAPHPLFPPADTEHPDWKNLSSTIGGQYWDPVTTFTNLQGKDSFIYQFLASQQPGTIDTSLVSTDQINNANTITAIFDLPARLARAATNVPEAQSASNLLIPQIEDPTQGTNPRHTPRVLLDGADSVGVFGALSRVYLNIGAYSEEWKRLHNTVIGFRPQRPFAVATNLKNSVYWRATDKYRIPYLAAFFTYLSPSRGESVTRPMLLNDTAEGKPIIAMEKAEALKGRGVFVQKCAICHSSKQPAGFDLKFGRGDQVSRWLKQGSAPALTLPMDFADWPAFLKTQAYGEYVRQIAALAGQPAADGDAFIKNNFLANEVRIPITLVGTNSGRALGTNGMRGQMWDNFSSETYKALPSVGNIHFFNPFSGKPTDQWGNNDSFTAPANGPGYYRPASLISLWATAPYLHNNALGKYNRNPSIKGRLEAFDDGIDKILWPEKRQSSPFRLPGDLRNDPAIKAANGDTGFIYRTTVASYIDFAPGFIKPLLTGVVGPTLVSFLTCGLWVALAVIFVAFAVFGKTRHAGFVFALVAVITAALLRVSGVDTIYPALWLLPLSAAVIALLLWFALPWRLVGRIVFALLAIGSLYTAHLAGNFVDGKSGNLRVGPVPQGTPVNLLMNMNPQASLPVMSGAVFGLARGILRINKDNLTGDAAWNAFQEEAAIPLMRASKSPDFVLDRGHWFAETLSDDEKTQLKAFLKTL